MMINNSIRSLYLTSEHNNYLKKIKEHTTDINLVSDDQIY